MHLLPLAPAAHASLKQNLPRPTSVFLLPLRFQSVLNIYTLGNMKSTVISACQKRCLMRQESPSTAGMGSRSFRNSASLSAANIDKSRPMTFLAESQSSSSEETLLTSAPKARPPVATVAIPLMSIPLHPGLALALSQRASISSRRRAVNVLYISFNREAAAGPATRKLGITAKSTSFH